MIVKLELSDPSGAKTAFTFPDMHEAEGCALEMLGMTRLNGQIIGLAQFFTGDGKEWKFDSEMEY